MRLLRSLEVILGLFMWCAVLWDAFATVVLPRTVAPMKRLSGRLTRLSWRLWRAIARRIKTPALRLNFVAIYGPFSAVVLLIVWACLMIVAFSLIYHGLGPRFQASSGPVDFTTLLYMSGSTFLTLGLGDVTSPEPLGRFFMVLEAASGFVFLGLVISYMPVLDQAYASREVGSLLIHSRLGSHPNAVKFLHHYASADWSEILRGNLREGERWMAEILESHVSHPVLSYYRALHLGQNWLIAVTMVLDSCALLIVGGHGMPAEQARLTYFMGVRLLEDLTHALALKVDPDSRMRLPEADLPALIAAISGSTLELCRDARATNELLRLVRHYDVYLVALSDWLLIPLPPLIPKPDAGPDAGSQLEFE
jgi:Ion channel